MLEKTKYQTISGDCETNTKDELSKITHAIVTKRLNIKYKSYKYSKYLFVTEYDNDDSNGENWTNVTDLVYDDNGITIMVSAKVS